jgi:hypothetical protein
MLTEDQFISAPTKYTLNKYLQNIGLNERKIISLPGVPTCLGPALPTSNITGYL